MERGGARSRVHAQFFLVDAAPAASLIDVPPHIRLLLETTHLIRAKCNGEPLFNGAMLIGFKDM